MECFINLMPKIELHAHLNGSFSSKTLLELGKQKYGETSKEFENLCDSVCIKNSCTLSECFQKFDVAHLLIDSKELLHEAVLLVLKDFSLDKVIYLELRTTPKNYKHMCKKEYLETVLKAILLAESKFGIIVKLLPSINRSEGVEVAEDTIKIVQELIANKDYKNIIKGIDFSGNPKSRTFNEYKEVLKLVKKMNLKLAVHCGEIENEKEITDMLLFGMDRCGHGTFIKDQNLELLKSKKIPVECCLSSNIKCETVKTFYDHHFKFLFNNEIPITICTDDFGVFNTSLSNELLIATNTFNLTKNDHLLLAHYSVEAAFANENEKFKVKKTIDAYFNENFV